MAPKSAGTPQQSKEKQKDVVIALAPTTPAAATAVDYASPVSVSSTTATWKCPICDEDGACGDLPRVVPWKAGAEPASEGSSSKVSLKDVDMPREMDKICSLVAHLVKAHPEHVVTRNKHRMVAVEDCCSTKIKRPKLDAVSWPYLEHFMFYHHTPTLHHLQCPLCKQGHTTREELRKCVTGAGTPKSKGGVFERQSVARGVCADIDHSPQLLRRLERLLELQLHPKEELQRNVAKRLPISHHQRS